MALGTERTLAVAGVWVRFWEWLAGLAKRLAVPPQTAARYISPLAGWLRRHPPVPLKGQGLQASLKR